MEQKELSLATLAGGAAVERFDLALQEVLDNIQDVNTLPKAKRQVILKVAIEPDEQRGVGKVVISCEVKVAMAKPFATHIYMGMDKTGRGVASEIHVPAQGHLFTDEDKAPKGQEAAADNVYKLQNKLE